MRVRRTRMWTAVWGLLFLLDFAACGEEEESGLPPSVPVWSVAEQPVLQIGVLDGEDEYLFRSISAVRLLPAGGVVVADPGLSALRVYDAGGTFVVSVGRQGEGPGEFSWLGYLDVRGDTVLVYDPSAHRLIEFMEDGRILETRQIKTTGGAPELYLGTYSDGGAAFGAIRSIERDPVSASSDQWTFGRYDLDGNLIRTLGTGAGYRRLGGRPVPFSANLHAFLLSDSIFYSDGRSPSINVLDDNGAVARTLSVDIPFVDAKEAWKVLRAELEEIGQLAFLDGVSAAAESEPIPWIAELLLDDVGRFWIKHFAPETDSWMVGGLLKARGGRWSIVHRDGTAVASIDLPAGFVPMDVRGDRIAGVEKDEMDVERVVVYRILH